MQKTNHFPLQIIITVSTQSESYFSLPTTEPISITKFFTTCVTPPCLVRLSSKKDNLNCVPKLYMDHFALKKKKSSCTVILLHFKNSNCYLLQTKHVRTFSEKTEKLRCPCRTDRSYAANILYAQIDILMLLTTTARDIRNYIFCFGCLDTHHISPLFSSDSVSASS